MKKRMNIFVLVATAAMALASCQKNEITGPETQEVHFTIKADIAETKTYITENVDKTYTPSWSKGDKIGVLFALEENAKAEDFENTAVAGEEATFEGKHAFTVVEGAPEVGGYLYAFYPSSAFDKVYSDGGVRLDLKVTQYPTSTSFDPSCDLLIAKPCYYMAEATGEDAEVVIDDMYFARMMSVLRINLNSEFLSNETVKSVSFDADGVDFTGAMKFNLATGEFVGNQSTSQDLSEVKAVYSEEDPIAVAGEKNSAYLVVAPVTIPSGTALTFTIETENYDIVKTITAPADMVMPAGNVAVINLSIAKENCTAKVEDTSDYSGEWLITGVKDEQVYAASAYVSGNNLKSVAISIENGQILEVDGIANCMMTLTKIADGGYAGMYTITDVNGKYLYAASSSGNQLKGATEVSVNAYWTVELQENGTYSIVASKSSNRNVMQFNGSDATNVLFNCYSSASQSPVTLYPYSMVKADTTPRITATTEISVSNDATTVDIPYTVKNITGQINATVADSPSITGILTSVEDEKVVVTFEANQDSDPKTATIVLSYDGAQDVNVVITQKGKPAEGGDASIETWNWEGGVKNDFTKLDGVTAYGLGSDYAASNAPYQLKLDTTGDYFTVEVDGAIQNVTIGVKMLGGANTSYLDVQASVDGNSFSDVERFTISGAQNTILDLVSSKQFDSSFRYLKFYFTKGSNVGVGPISITYIPSDGGETPDPTPDPDPDPTPDPEQPSTSTASIDFTILYSANTTLTDLSYTIGDATLTFGNTGNTKPQYYSNGSAVRFYGMNEMTISSDKNIVKIVFTFTTKPTSTDSSFTPGTFDYETSTWTGSTNSIQIKNTASSGNWRFSKIDVTYEN